jgi:DNA polymerase-1
VEDLSNVNITMARRTEDVLEFLRWLGERRSVLAIDTETGGLDRWRDPLRLVQLGDRDSAWCFDAAGWMGLLRDVLERYDGPRVFHNAKFDVHFLERFMTWSDLMWKVTHDTAVMAHLVDPVSGRDLKGLTTRYINPKAAIAQRTLDNAMSVQKWGWNDIPVDYPLYWAYGGLDTILTARLYDYLLPLQNPALYDLEQKTIYVTHKMEKRGLHIDLKHCHDKIVELEAFVQQVRDWARTTYSIENITSDVQCLRVLEADGVQFTKMTDSGARYSLDADVLESIDHPLAETLLKARKSIKITNTYLKNFVTHHDNEIFHADINTLGTRTGRMTAGIMQTLTRGKGPVRDSFTSRYENGRMVLVDFDQIEMRLLAIMSEDTELQKTCLSGDLFTTMARRVFNDPNMPKSDERRQHLKNARYARAYGAGIPKIALTNGLPIEEVEVIEAGWTEQYPQAARFPMVVDRIARQRLAEEGVAYVRTPIGRYEPAKGSELYQLTNYLMQGFAADVFKAALVRLDEAGLDEYFVMPIHDEAAFDVPGEIAADVAATACKIMQDDSYAIPLTTGADVVERWGDKYL